MNKLRKFLAMVLVAVMTLSLSGGLVSEGAMAAEATAVPQGSITVNNAADGQSYDAYRIFNVSYEGDKPVYSVNSGWETFFKSVAGKKYIVDPGTNEEKFKPVVIDGKTRYMNINAQNVHTFASDAHVHASMMAQPDASAVATGGVAVFDKLPLGYYIVYEKDASQVQGQDDALCHLTVDEPNLVIDSDGAAVSIEKAVDDADKIVEIGQEVTFTVTGEVPDTTEYSEYIYEIQDIMAGLELTGDFKVTLGNDVQDITNEVEQGRTRMLPAKGAKNFGLQINMRQYQEYVGQPVTISYKAVVTEQAEGTYSNRVTLDYSNNPKTASQTMQTQPQEVVLTSYDIEITKTDADQASPFPLAGAEFIMYRDNNGITEYYHYAGSDNEKPKVAWVTLEEGESVEEAVEAKKITAVMTGRDGKARFKGVIEGKYGLKEIKAPENYNIAEEDTVVTVNKDVLDDYIVKVDIKASKVEGAATNAGVGIGVFVVAGVAVLLVFLLMNRKKHVK